MRARDAHSARCSINSAYLAASASPTLFYFSNILLHIALGLALAIVCLRPRASARRAKPSSGAQGFSMTCRRITWLLLSSPRSRAQRWYLSARRRRTCGCCARTSRRLSPGCDVCCLRRSCGPPRGRAPRRVRASASLSPSCVIVLASAIAAVHRVSPRRHAPRRRYRIVNPDVVPAANGRGRRGPGEPVLSFIGEHDRQRAPFRRTSF